MATASTATAQARDELPPGHAGAHARLISIDIRHDYCNRTGGRFDGISISPTAFTAERLARYGIVTRERADGIDLFYNRVQAAAVREFMTGLPSDPPDGLFGPPLLFTMQLKDPLFFNFTDTPTNVRSGNPALLLSNRRARITGPQIAELEMSWENGWGIVRPHAEAPAARPSPDDKPGERGAAPRDLAEQARPGEDEEGLLEAWWLESHGEMDNARKEQADVLLRTRYLPFGLARIFLAPSRGSAETRGADDWNGFPIDLRPSDPNAPRSDAEGYIRPSRYVVRFPARKTWWRYIIAGRGELDLEGLSITDEKGKERFSAAEPKLLPDGSQASCFVAREPVALSQRPEAAFTLKAAHKEGNGRTRVLIKRLPAPTAESILPDPHPPPGKTWSDVYVFV